MWRPRALDVQVALFDAHSQSGSTRHRHLRAADAGLNKLRLYLRLAHRWRWINDGQYEHVSRLIAEIGRLNPVGSAYAPPPSPLTRRSGFSGSG